MFREFAIARVRADDTHDQWMAQAWWTAALTGRNLPQLKTLLAKRDATELANIKSTLFTIAAAYKLKLRKGKKKKGKKR